MNIFYLDPDPVKCAQYQVDRHVVKMAVESTQILCSAYFKTGEDYLSHYKKTHLNHPCCKWAAESLSNWLWLRELGLALCDEYTYRYGKTHKCKSVIESLVVPSLPDIGFTELPLVMDEIYITDGGAVDSYRNYYRCGKRGLWSWKRRGIPEWLREPTIYN